MKMDPILLYTILPIIFMIHEFEEIIMYKWFFKNNNKVLLEKYKKIGPKIVNNYKDISTGGFSLAIFIEFIIISCVVYLAIIFEKQYLWLVAFMD